MKMLSRILGVRQIAGHDGLSSMESAAIHSVARGAIAEVADVFASGVR